MELQSKNKNEKYQLLPPDGGWGYVVAFAIALVMNATYIPMCSFGLIFGKFLATIGEETTGTTLANGIFNSSFNITGLAANYLLQRYTYRFVGLVGAAIFFIGSFATIFVTTLTHMIISFGVIQGVGMGLMFASFFTALNFYFDKKLATVNGVCQALMVAGAMCIPFPVQYCMTHYGFRGTVAIISALSLNAILAAIALQPVEWHMKKEKISVDTEESIVEGKVQKYVLPKVRESIISVGDRAMSVTTLNSHIHDSEKQTWWQLVVKVLDLQMFKDPVYVNISIGLALGFTADVAFISIIPLVLINSGVDYNTAAFLVFVFFASDLVARISLSLLSAFFRFKNRHYFLIGCFLLVIFRTAFVLSEGYYWKLVMTAAVGFLRAPIQTPLPLVISEQYSDNFSTAFSLYMVVGGIVSFLFGPLMSFVKALTQSDVMVVHLLSLANLAVGISWSVELVMKRWGKAK